MPFKFILCVLWINIILLISNKTEAQISVPSVLNYENASGEKGISIYEFDGNLRMIKGSWHLLDDSRNSVNYYLYNEKGQLIDKYREFSDSIKSSLKYEYNKDGIKTAEDFWRSDGVAGKSIFEYDENGALIKILCNKYSGWFDGEIHYIPGSNGNPKSGKLFQNNEKIGDIELEYDESGNLLIEKWIISDWSQTFEWEYHVLPQSYTSSNVFINENSRYRLIKENYSYNNQTNGPSFYTYEDGKLSEKTFVRSDSLKTVTTYTYDENGILLESIRKFNSGKTTTFTYKYNDERKLVERNFKSDEEETGSEKYFYDKNGDLQKAIWENFDGWLTGKIKFEMSRNGRVKKGTFKGKNRNATLYFKYDPAGNLAEINWEFKNGVTQTYQFEYLDLNQ